MNKSIKDNQFYKIYKINNTDKNINKYLSWSSNHVFSTDILLSHKYKNNIITLYIFYKNLNLKN